MPSNHPSIPEKIMDNGTYVDWRGRTRYCRDEPLPSPPPPDRTERRGGPLPPWPTSCLSCHEPGPCLCFYCLRVTVVSAVLTGTIMEVIHWLMGLWTAP